MQLLCACAPGFARAAGLALLAVLASCQPHEPGTLLAAVESPLARAAPLVPIGARVPDLDFTDGLGLPRRTSEVARGRPLVIAFTTVGCPLAQRYLPVLGELEREFRARGVAFLALDVGAATPLEAAQQALEHGVDFPIAKDLHGSAAAATGAQRSPEVVLLDAAGALRYRGRVDGRYRLAGARPDAGREDLREALEDVLAGRDVAVPSTAADGCPLEPERVAADASLAWNEHVAPILAEKCAPCHRPASSAPFALLSHRDVARRARVVEEVVESGRMPPWFAAEATEEHGGFANDLSLDDDERRVLLAWLRAGAPAGDGEPVELEPPPLADWTPDLVLDAPAVDVPASGYLGYHYELLPHVFQRETWVQSVRLEPSERALVHHAVVMVVDPRRTRHPERHWGSWGRPLFIYVPGRPEVSLPDGVALRVPAGYQLGLQVHYVTDGRARADRERVALRFPRARVQQRLRTLVLTDHELLVPPHAPAHLVTREASVDHAIEVHSVFPHMHLRGRDLALRAIRPDGRAETLLSVPAYHFDWQHGYELDPRRNSFPADTRFEYTARFDNSAYNVLNPDPAAAVPVGEQTTDEMLYAWIFHTRAGERLEIEVDSATGAVRGKRGKPRRTAAAARDAALAPGDAR